MSYNINVHKTRAETERSFPWAKIHTAYLGSTELGFCSEASRWYYIALTLLAVSLDGDGHIYSTDGLVNKSLKEIAWHFRVDPLVLVRAFDELTDAGLIERQGDYLRLTRYTMEQVDQKNVKEDQEHKRKLNAARQEEWRKKNGLKDPTFVEKELEKELEKEVDSNALHNALLKDSPSPKFSNDHSQAVFSFCKKIGWGDEKSIEAAEKRKTYSQYKDFISFISKKGNPVAIEELEKINADEYRKRREDEMAEMKKRSDDYEERMRNHVPLTHEITEMTRRAMKDKKI